MMFDKLKDLYDCIKSIKHDAETTREYAVEINNKFSDCMSKIEAVEKRIEKLEEIDDLIKKVNTLSTENIKLKEENSIYLKYYDINSEATDEIKKEVFAEFEMRRLQKVNESLQTQLEYAQSVASFAATCTALSAYNNPFRFGWY